MHQQLQLLTERVEKLEQQRNREQSATGDKLLFDFNNIQKKDVYMMFLDLHRRGGIKSRNDQLIHFLAKHTNLGSESSINNQFYDYKRSI